MHHSILKGTLLAALLSVLTISTMAQDAVQAGITVNGELLTRKVLWIRTDNQQSSLGFTYEAVALVYADDDNNNVTDYEIVHPLAFQMLFGVLTGIEDIYDLGSQQGDQLSLKGLKAGQKVLVYNAAGQLCQATTVAPGQTLIRLQHLPAGMYVLKSGKVAIKFIKK